MLEVWRGREFADSRASNGYLEDEFPLEADVHAPDEAVVWCRGRYGHVGSGACFFREASPCPENRLTAIPEMRRRFKTE